MTAATPERQPREGAVALEAQADRAGRMWISIDSLVDLFADMASGLEEGPGKKTLHTLEATFRPMSTYAGMEKATAEDGSRMVARNCATCSVAVIDGERLGGKPIVIDATPVPDGSLFPMKIRAGVPLLAPYSNTLEGTVGPRLREHACIGAQA